MQRLFAFLAVTLVACALSLSVGPPALPSGAPPVGGLQGVSAAHHPGAVPAIASCSILGQKATSPAILAPPDQVTVSNAVTIAVAPSGTNAGVAVCANYQFPLGTQQFGAVVALPDALGRWSASWDVSQLPEQSGVVLSFIANDVSGGSALIGSRTITIDHTAPATVFSILGSNQYTTPSGVTYVAGNTPLSLTASDPPLEDGSAGSGATAIFQIDGGGAQSYASPFTLGALGDGPHTVAYWSVDGAGNAEKPHSVQLVLDTQPPTITPLVSGSFNADGSAYSPVSVAFAATDGGSGLRGVSYAIEPGFMQPYAPGQQIAVAATSRLDYAATDQVGNAFIGTLPITIATPTPTPGVPFQATDTPTPTNVPTSTPTPRPSPSSTRTPRPAHVPTSTRTPRPTPTWSPIDGPPILNRTPTSRAIHGAIPVHVHVMRAARRSRAASCSNGPTCSAHRRHAASGRKVGNGR